jgi:hypothetical protein
MSSSVQDLPYPDILWHLHKQVPKGLEVCQDLRRLGEIQYNAPYHAGISLCTAGTAVQEVEVK